ncbi:OLC1v1014813C2 [Oldenlandia corymbosa var. corymbosa]|uniref:OLC1v1014813C2 n=1 Tax=Oldenlandia corymbosa var. corymbosa TaxID=529605 RepID=A0AAV1E1S7_OLDCO|nr:OLC1v1014813C2 [Oldenlandia corymbosa var. corymbosa]
MGVPNVQSKWKKTALLVIDMQNDFILPESRICLKGGQAIVPNVIRSVEIARERAFRRHMYSSPGAPKPACKGSFGAELVDGLAIEEDDYKLVKTRFSSFFNTHLHSYLQGSGICHLVITGVQTPNCIRQTAFDAVALDYQSVSVITDATAAASSEIHLENIIDMKNIGITTPTLEAWVKLVKMAASDTTIWKKTALLVIDMQNDFILPGGPMYVKGGQAVVPNVIKSVDIARNRGIHIIWVVREHDPLGRDVEAFRRHLYSPGQPKPTSKGSFGAELVDGLVIKDNDYKLVKTRFSAFFNTHLHSYLQSTGISNLVITGVQTPNCIRQTVFDAVALDYQSVTVIVDATAAATPEIHLANVADMNNIGVTSPTLEEWAKSDA